MSQKQSSIYKYDTKNTTFHSLAYIILYESATQYHQFYCRGMNFTDLAKLKWEEIDLSSFSYVRNKTGIKLNVKDPR